MGWLSGLLVDATLWYRSLQWTPTIKSYSLLLHNGDFATVWGHIVNLCFLLVLGNPVKGLNHRYSTYAEDIVESHAGTVLASVSEFTGALLSCLRRLCSVSSVPWVFATPSASSCSGFPELWGSGIWWRHLLAVRVWLTHFSLPLNQTPLDSRPS